MSHSLEYKFARQIERAFYGAGLRPIFDIRRVNGAWKIEKMKRLENKNPVNVYYPWPENSDFLDLGFQERFTKLIEAHPIRVGGKVKLSFEDPKTGRPQKIHSVRWKAEISKINKIEADITGTLTVESYRFRRPRFKALASHF